MTGGKRAGVLLIIVTGISLAFGPRACCDEQKKVYLFTSFRGNGEDGLHLAYSYDGYHWTDLEKQGDHNHRIYYVTTRDFESFSKAKLLYEHGFNV